MGLMIYLDKPSQNKYQGDEVDKGQFCVETVDSSVHKEHPALL
jgi:hypothetical protein